MITLRQAVELTLSAIEEGVSFDHLDNVTAPMLRRALAEPEQEPVAIVEASWNDDEGFVLVKRLVKSLPKGSYLYTAPPQRKPLTLLMITTAYEQGVGKGHQAYRRKEEIENPYTPGDCHEAWRLGYKEGKTQAGDIKDAPARKPLTEEEIWQIVTDCTIGSDLHADKLARAIEAAHGIGEKHDKR